MNTAGFKKIVQCDGIQPTDRDMAVQAHFAAFVLITAGNIFSMANFLFVGVMFLHIAEILNVGFCAGFLHDLLYCFHS